MIINKQHIVTFRERGGSEHEKKTWNASTGPGDVLSIG